MTEGILSPRGPFRDSFVKHTAEQAPFTFFVEMKTITKYMGVYAHVNIVRPGFLGWGATATDKCVDRIDANTMPYNGTTCTWNIATIRGGFLSCTKWTFIKFTSPHWLPAVSSSELITDITLAVFRKLYHQSSVLAIQQLVDSWIISQTVPEGSSTDPQVQVRMAEFPHPEYAENGFWADVSQRTSFREPMVPLWWDKAGSGVLICDCGAYDIESRFMPACCSQYKSVDGVKVASFHLREKASFWECKHKRFFGGRGVIFVCRCVQSPRAVLTAVAILVIWELTNQSISCSLTQTLE